MFAMCWQDAEIVLLDNGVGHWHLVLIQEIIELYHGALIAASLLAFFFLTSVSKTSNSIQSDSYLITSHNLPIIFHHHQLLLSLSWFRILQVAKATGENPFSSFHRFWIFLSHHLSHTCSSSYPKFSCLIKSTSHGHRFLGYLRRTDRRHSLGGKQEQFDKLPTFTGWRCLCFAV